MTEHTARNIEEGQQEEHTPQPAKCPGKFHSSYDATQLDGGDTPAKSDRLNRDLGLSVLF